MSEIPSISQSLIKAVRKYIKGEYCGLRLKAIWIEKSHREPETISMRQGQWFEYMATGQKNFYGEVPKPDRTPSKAASKDKTRIKNFKDKVMRHLQGKANRELCEFQSDDPKEIIEHDRAVMEKAVERKRNLFEMADNWLYNRSPVGAKFQHATEQAERFKQYAKEYGWEWKTHDIGQRIENEGMSGFIDLRPTIPKDSPSWPRKGTPGYRDDYPKWSRALAKVTVDLKYSGLMDNYYDSMGWHPDALDMKHDLMVQAVQYTILTGAPFFFFVFSASANNFDARLIPVIVSEGRIAEHRQEVKNTRNIIVQNMRSGFRAFPSVSHCEDCPLRDNCEKRAIMPLPSKIIRY